MRFCFTINDFVEKTIQPNKLAVIGDSNELTWKEFEEKTNQLISFFKDHSIDKLETPVIIYGHKDTNMLVAIYAMKKAEITYIPIDVIYPIDRIQKVLQTAKSELLINTTGIQLHIENTSELRFFKNEIKFTLEKSFSVNDLRASDPLVYIIFTSGSTGNPKGVQISTEAVQSFTRWMTSSDFSFSSDDTFINTALLSFDLSVFEVMTFAAIGGTILLNNKEQSSNPNILMTRIDKYKASVWVSTPSFCLTYSRIKDTELMKSIHTFLFCGEVLPNSLAKALLDKYPHSHVLNTYGPTEATVATTIVNVTSDLIDKYNPLPVGKSKMESLLLIENDEIIIIGPNVSTGYVNNEILNKEKFIVVDNQRAFKTGDKGYIKNDMLFFHGRNDDLVKLHGYRIELNEITSSLDALTYVAQAETIALKRNGEVKKIVSLVQLVKETKKSKNEIQQDLRSILPSYMVPSDIKVVDYFPLNQNGKADKKILTELYLKR